MRVLLDTHALLWALADDDRLSVRAREVISSLENDVLVSAVSAWEIAIKSALGKLRVPDDLEQAVDAAGFVRKNIGFAPARRLRDLPAIHRDPFDRMLIAQAMEEGIPLVTTDGNITRYPIQTIW
jgi:PIN domain nuclease of toxin-antitoxin system